MVRKTCPFVLYADARLIFSHDDCYSSSRPLDGPEPCAVWLLLSRQAVPAFITEMAGLVVSVNYTPCVIKTRLLVDLDRRKRLARLSG